MSVLDQKKTEFWHFLICFIYFLSGATALAYEVLWARMLSNIFGVSIFGIVVTVAAFMAGLGFGSVLGAKLIRHFKNPLFIFAIAELVVAVFAFNLPLLFATLDNHIQSFSANQGYTTWLVVQSLFTFIVMFIPALLLGVGFPMILNVLRSSTINIGLIYGINTLGGVLGCLLPLALLPVLGWTDALRVFAYLGVFVSVLAVAFSLFHALIPKQKITGTPTTSNPKLWFLIAYAAVGAGSIMLQIAWTRLFGMVLLRTEYVMAIILATFLLGMGVGSVLGTKLRSLNLVFYLAVAVSFSALASIYLLPEISAWAETANYSSLASSMFWQGLVICIFTLPATLAFGAWLPIITAQFSTPEHAGAKIYGFNAIGAALGGLISGFIILPLAGSTAVIFVATLFVLIASLYWIKQPYLKLLPVVFIVLFIPAFSFPPVNQLLPASQQNSKDLSFYEDAVSLTHVVEDNNGQRLLLADLQRMDASTEPTAVTVQKNQARLPILLHPNPQSVLFLGLGTGITVAGSLPYPGLTTTAVELSQGAIYASEHWFAPVNSSVNDKVNIVQDDARRFLKSAGERYDIIVGDLFHPDLVGRSALLSRQQFARAKNRLADNGIFVQWIALNQFDLTTLKVVLATFKEVFPQAVLFVDGFRVAMVGANDQFTGFRSFRSHAEHLPPDALDELSGKEGIYTWSSRYWGKITGVGTRIQDEWAPVIEFQLPRAKFNRQMDFNAILDFLKKHRPSVEQAMSELAVSENEVAKFSQAYAATSLYYESWIDYFSGRQADSERKLMMALAQNENDQWIGFGVADALYASFSQTQQQGINELDALRRILSIRPDHIGALKRVLQISEEKGWTEQAAALKNQLKKLSPLDKDFT